jgi:hypothetical protein
MTFDFPLPFGPTIEEKFYEVRHGTLFTKKNIRRCI